MSAIAAPCAQAIFAVALVARPACQQHVLQVRRQHRHQLGALREAAAGQDDALPRAVFDGAVRMPRRHRDDAPAGRVAVQGRDRRRGLHGDAVLLAQMLVH